MKSFWIVWLGGVLFSGMAPAQESPPCAQAAAAFVQHATPHTLAALGRENDAACWRIFSAEGMSAQLSGLVIEGNPVAARYLAAHLGRLDGSAQESALQTLGRFADRRMGLFLGLVRQGVLGEPQAIRALTSTPPGLADNRVAQLRLLLARRQRLGLRAGTTHAPIQTDALRALDAEIAIRRAYPTR